MLTLLISSIISPYNFFPSSYSLPLDYIIHYKKINKNHFTCHTKNLHGSENDNLINRFLIITSLLIIVPALSMNFFTADDKPDSFKQKNDSSDFYMHNATLNKFNDHGKLAHKLEAKSFSYYPEKKQTDLIQPSLNITGEKINVLWEITAKKGKITSGRNVTQEIVEFWDKVSATTKNNGRKSTQ